jgi:hypothetical protein
MISSFFRPPPQNEKKHPTHILSSVTVIVVFPATILLYNNDPSL